MYKTIKQYDPQKNELITHSLWKPALTFKTKRFCIAFYES